MKPIFKIYLTNIAFFLLSTGYGQQKNNDVPNILWIITDDHRADSAQCVNRIVLGTNNSKLGYVLSPNIDNLAKEGTLFTNAFCNSPACAPSRSSMMTGQYPHHSGRYGFEQTHNQIDFSKPTLPELLKASGYQTSLFGKSGYRIFEWKNGLSWKDLGFYDLKIDIKHDLKFTGNTDFVNNLPKTQNSETFIFENNKKTEIQTDLKKPNRKRKKLEKELEILRSYSRSQKNLIIGGQSPRPAFKTLDGFIVNEFQNYLQNKNKPYNTLGGRNISGPNTKLPQFISLNFHFPHTPILPPKKFRDLFKNKKYQIPDFDKNKELKQLPVQLRKLYEKMKIDTLTPEEKQQAIRDYYAFCAYGDALIGKAVQSFKKYNQEIKQEYIIVLTIGDHGWQLGEQGIEAKFAPYKTSNKGAIIVSSSNNFFPSNTVNTDFVEYVDLVPTMLSAAKINVEKLNYLDGYNLSDVVTKKVPKRDYVLGEMNHVIGPRAYIRSNYFSFSMRVRQNSRNKYNSKNNPGNNIKWGVNCSLEEAEVALFDLRKDPNEQYNIALQKDYKKLSKWFKDKLTNIVLGDNRLEVDWSQKNNYFLSDFAVGSDDKKLDIPTEIII